MLNFRPISRRFPVCACACLGAAWLALPAGAEIAAGFATTQLVRPPDSVGAFPHHINSRGQIVGFFRDAREKDHACAWPDAAAAPVKLQKVKVFDTYAYGSNDSGEIVGYWTASVINLDRACYWKSAKAEPVELKLPVGGLSSNAYAISRSGAIVGVAKSLDGEKRAMFWRDSRAEPIALETPRGASSFAYSINAAGAIVGYIKTRDGKQYACVWPSTNDRAVKLQAPAGDGSSDAWAIDDAGRIAGYFEKDGKDRLCLWDSGTSQGVPAPLPVSAEQVLHVTPKGWALGYVSVNGKDEPRLWRSKDATRQ